MGKGNTWERNMGKGGKHVREKQKHVREKYGKWKRDR